MTLNEPANLPVVQKVPASSAATAVPVNFMAQMVQTGSTVTAGRANGTATFVLEYN
ncbi:fimbrial protein [Citrobacter amalonaticus]|uniref:fimbrial protein n=1 Tax=Citrobacter amalonaticus TaxID=35703 RepID=UPI0018A95EC6|nr:fimbrial protein [Citrobacter amalonaticus]